MRTFFKTAFLIILLHNLLFTKANSQTAIPVNFYKHFSGTIDSNMFVSFDLFSQNGKIEGQYYYYFHLPGVSQKHYGKTILLEGNIQGNNLEMNEKGNVESKFSAKFEEDTIITGTWQRKKHENPSSLYIKEDYSNGSIPLQFLSKTSKHSLNAYCEKTGKPIQAKISLQILYPERSRFKLANDSINYWISKIIMNTDKPVVSTSLLVENIIFDYFQSYVEATSGIENIGKTSSFGWEKEFSMRTAYNENNLLSIQFTKYAFTGGAHGIQMNYFKVFRISDFSTLHIEDLFEPPGFLELGKRLEIKLRKLNGIKIDSPLRENGFFIDTLKPNDNFYLNHDGIGFFYNIYEIASYASGSTQVFLPYSEIKKWLKPEFWPPE